MGEEGGRRPKGITLESAETPFACFEKKKKFKGTGRKGGVSDSTTPKGRTDTGEARRGGRPAEYFSQGHFSAPGKIRGVAKSVAGSETRRGKRKDIVGKKEKGNGATQVELRFKKNMKG